jgi:Protein of unknown function
MDVGGDMIPASEIDQLLLSFCSDRWQKVVKIIGKTFDALEQRQVRVSADEIDIRMAALVTGGPLEAKGNIRKWTHSEVRLQAPS